MSDEEDFLIRGAGGGISLTNTLLVLVLLALLANLVVSVNRTGGTEEALRDLLSLLFATVVLCHLTCAGAGIKACTRLLERRDRPSLRFIQRGFVWSLLTVGALAAAPLFDVPIHQVIFVLVMLLGFSALITIGLYRELPQAARQPPHLPPDEPEQTPIVLPAPPPQTDEPPSPS